MSEKERPRTNPRAGSSDPELWDADLDWYFNCFDAVCGLQSIGTSGAGQNQLRKPTEEEKAERKERLKNGFLLTMPPPPKSQAHSVNAASLDDNVVEAIGAMGKGRRVWLRLLRVPLAAQAVLRQAYEERLREAGADWGPRPLTDDEVRAAHRAWRGQAYEPPIAAPEQQLPPNKPWKNPPAQGVPFKW